MRTSFWGQLAQLVEQRTENPRVRGSIPRLATLFSPILQRRPMKKTWRIILACCCAFLPLGVGATNLFPVEIKAQSVFPHLDFPQNEQSLWARIRKGFAMPDIEDALTLRYQRFYESNPAYLKRIVRRAKPFLYPIVEEIEKRNLPTELALLPMVESAFNPNAYSRAKASGLWQFIPATGKRFRLEQNYWVDERRDILASTEAALSYLQSIYDLHGDWHLALASYNWGEGAVGRAVTKNAIQDLPTDYLNLNVPNETRHYVPKLQALKNIFGDPFLLKSLGVEDILNRPYLGSVQLKDSMDRQTAASLAGLTEAELAQLNPAHNRALLMADTELLLPEDKIELFEDNLENFDAPLHNLKIYRLKQNLSLAQFAKQNGFSLKELALINGLPEKTVLKTGSALLITKNIAGAKDLEAFLSEHGTPELWIQKAVAKKRKKNLKKRPVTQTAARKSNSKT